MTLGADTKHEVKAGGMASDDTAHEAAFEKGEMVASTDIPITEEPEKAYHSKQSVWLMILFSGLAIGSDGYNGMPSLPDRAHHG